MDSEAIYRALIGEPPSSAEEIAAVAKALRGQRAFGELGALTGDRVLSPFGISQMRGADTTAKEVGENRATAAQAKGLEEWRKMQYDQGERQLREDARGHDLTFQARTGAKAGEDAERNQKEIDKGTYQLSSKLQQYGIPAVRTSISNLNNEIITQMNDPKNKGQLPGVGYAKNLPGAELFLSDAGKDVKSKIQAVSNDLLKMYSGMAVTVPEADRRALEQMSKGTFNSEDFLRAWPSIVSRFNGTIGGLKGGYNPQVQKAYADNGGMSLDDITAYSHPGHDPMNMDQSGGNYPANPPTSPTGDNPADNAPAVPASWPKPGTIKNGFQYGGGDPKDKNNWFPVAK